MGHHHGVNSETLFQVILFLLFHLFWGGFSGIDDLLRTNQLLDITAIMNVSENRGKNFFFRR